jgi:hypothetical protein
MAHANATHKQILLKIYKIFDILKVSNNRTLLLRRKFNEN